LLGNRDDNPAAGIIKEIIFLEKKKKKYNLYD